MIESTPEESQKTTQLNSRRFYYLFAAISIIVLIVGMTVFKLYSRNNITTSSQVVSSEKSQIVGNSNADNNQLKKTGTQVSFTKPELQPVEEEIQQWLDEQVKNPAWKYPAGTKIKIIGLYDTKEIPGSIDQKKYSGNSWSGFWKIDISKDIVLTEQPLVNAFLEQLSVEINEVLPASKEYGSYFIDKNGVRHYDIRFFLDGDQITFPTQSLVEFQYGNFADTQNWMECENKKDFYKIHLPKGSIAFIERGQAGGLDTVDSPDYYLGKSACPIKQNEAVHYFLIPLSDIPGKEKETAQLYVSEFLLNSEYHRGETLDEYIANSVTDNRDELKPYNSNQFDKAYYWDPRDGLHNPQFIGVRGNRIYTINRADWGGSQETMIITDSVFNSIIKTFETN